MTGTPVAASPRLEWAQVASDVREAVECALGSPVVTAVTQHGGFSPGAAVRVVCADGTRAFVKACSSSLDPDTPDLNRAEIAALQLIPEELPVARLLASYDDGDWVALVLEDIEGRRPPLPWSAADVSSVTSTLEAVAATPAHDGFAPFAVAVDALTAWDDVVTDPTGVNPSLIARLPELLDLQARAREVTRGDALVHWDARNDNILIRPDGSAALLDWAWASRGAPWLDTLLLAVDFVVQGGPDPDAYLSSVVLTSEVDPQDLRAMLACMVGIWAERSRRPAPPGLPTIRAWQAHCASESLRWLDGSALWK